MLKYDVRQLYLKDEEMYYLPIPKLSPRQMVLMREELRARGFSVTGVDTLRARKGETWLSVNPAGFARSPADLLDAVVPPLARMLGEDRSATASNPYFVLKEYARGFELHFFPRLEALGRWTSLRREGECGLTPDERLVLERVLSGSTEETIECVTDYPTEGCSSTQYGKNSYFRSRLASPEFLSNLRTISKASRRNTYLPRTSIFRVKGAPPPLGPSTVSELGEWCYLDFLPKSSNSGL